VSDVPALWSSSPSGPLSLRSVGLRPRAALCPPRPLRLNPLPCGRPPGSVLLCVAVSAVQCSGLRPVRIKPPACRLGGGRRGSRPVGGRRVGRRPVRSDAVRRYSYLPRPPAAQGSGLRIRVAAGRPAPGGRGGGGASDWRPCRGRARYLGGTPAGYCSRPHVCYNALKRRFG